VPCEQRNYSDVDASQWACVRETVKREYGIDIQSDASEATEKGFKLRWRYEPGPQSLEVQCLDKPFIVPCGVVNGRITKAIAQCGVAT
jgi:hypothetical protein